MAQQKLKDKHRCHSQHIHPHNKVIDSKYCKYCDALVQVYANKVCMCCGNRTSFKDKKSKRQEQSILNHFVSSYAPLIKWYEKHTMKQPIILQLKVGNWIYQIDVKWVCKYLDAWDSEKNGSTLADTIKKIKPHIHKVDFEISWNRSHVTIE